MSAETLPVARQRIQHCKAKGRDHLNLAGLALTDAELAGIAEFKDLTGLRYLDLTANALTILPPGVGTFTELLWLGLNFNRLTSLEGVEKLAKLQRLYARGNVLSDLPDMEGGTQTVMEVDFTANQFANPCQGLLGLLERCEDDGVFVMDENPGEFALRAKDGVAEFRTHVRELLEQGVDVREGKLLLVGEGRMGKSSLLQALRGEPFRDLGQSHGLRMEPLDLNTANGQVRLNCWDFSGQKELRETHQIFFTEPAIYLVVWNAGATVTVEDLREWLWLIKHRTNGKGRALIVATNTRANPNPLTDEQTLRDEFGGPDGILLAPKFLYVECNDTAPSVRTGVEELKDHLRHIIEGDEAFCQKRIKSWRAAQDRLAERAKQERFLSWADFVRECGGGDRAIPEAEVRKFAKHQNDVGRMVWVDRGAMASHVILGPDWLSKALGFIIRAPFTADVPGSPGLMRLTQVKAIWRNPGLLDENGNPEPPMPEEMDAAFCAFMEEFDIAHRIDRDGEETEYLIPQRLSPSRPPEWAAAPDGGNQEQLLRRIELKGYDGERSLNRWLTRAFFFRLMVRCYPYLLGRDDAARSINWALGFAIEERYYGQAKVSCSEKGIYLEASGSYVAPLWERFSASVELLGEYIRKHVRTEIVSLVNVPCGGIGSNGKAIVCSRKPEERWFIDEKFLLECNKRSWEEVDCRGKDCFEKLNVASLLRGLRPRQSEAKLEAIHRELIDMKGGVQSLREDGDSMIKTLQALLGSTQRVEQLGEEQKHLLERATGEIKELIQHTAERMDSPDRNGPCLFVIQAVDPKFLSDRGELFGKKFRLLLYCEALLKPVCWLKDTSDQGVFTFEMDHAWWSRLQPYLKATGRSLAWFSTAAAILGPPVAAATKTASGVSDQIDKLLTRPEMTLPGGRIAGKGENMWGVTPLQAEGCDLGWLHDFLRNQCGGPATDLKTNPPPQKLGLQRVLDKTTWRYRWVHHTQVGNYTTTSQRTVV